MDKEVKSTNLLDFILAFTGTLFFVAGYFTLRYGFGITMVFNEGEDKINPVLIYVVSALFAILYAILIDNVERWVKLLITHNGNRLYNKKYKDGFPVDLNNSGYKYIEANIIINETSDLIERYNDIDRFEEIVWYHNMESRQKSYSRVLRAFRKKLNKKYSKAKKRRLEEQLGVILDELRINRLHIGLCSELLENVTVKDREEVIRLDELLYEHYDIEPMELDPQILLDNEYNGTENFIDKIRNSKTWHILTTWIFPIMLGVGFIIVGFLYSWVHDKNYLEDYRIVLNLLVFYLATKVPTTIYKAIVNYDTQTLRPKLQASFIFKKYKVERNKAEQEVEEVTIDEDL